MDLLLHKVDQLRSRRVFKKKRPTPSRDKTRSPRVKNTDAPVGLIRQDRNHTWLRLQQHKNGSKYWARVSTRIISRTGCPYCTRAIALLDKFYAGYAIDNVSATGPSLTMKECNFKTVPQIWIHGVYVGGYDDLVRMQAK